MCLSPDAVILFYSDVSVESWLQSGLWEHKKEPFSYETHVKLWLSILRNLLI